MNNIAPKLQKCWKQKIAFKTVTKMPTFRVADVALSLTLNVPGVELPFNRVTSVIFCLNLQNKRSASF